MVGDKYKAELAALGMECRKMAREFWKFDGSEDVMDSRDIIERINELEALDADTGLNEDGKEELKQLKALADVGEDYCSDWAYGETLIRDEYFEEHTRELIEECYPEVSKALESSSWPMRCLTMDYEQAALELQQDYTSVDFAGSTYWFRSV